MKYPNETEEEFQKRFHEAQAKGICVFRDDANREFILDLIYDYCDVLDATMESDKYKDVKEAVVILPKKE